MDRADLYFEQIALNQYLSEEECKRCGADSCKELVDELNSGVINVLDLSSIPKEKTKAMEFALNGRDRLPEVPILTLPRRANTELVELNNPQNGDPVIVTGNNQYTQEVILTVLSVLSAPLFVLFSETHGDTLDMAVIFESFNARSIGEFFEQSGLNVRASSSPVIIPGKAVEVQQSIQKRLRLNVELGPVCAAELPLYLNAR